MKIVITGTSSGIGRGLAERYCNAGHEVWGLARRDQREFAERLRVAGRVFRHNRVYITQWEQLVAWCDHVTTAWGRIDALVCCAGMQGPLGPAMGFPPEA